MRRSRNKVGRYHVELATTYRPHDEKHNTNYLMERLERLKRNVFVKSNERKYQLCTSTDVSTDDNILWKSNWKMNRSKIQRGKCRDRRFPRFSRQISQVTGFTIDRDGENRAIQRCRAPPRLGSASCQIFMPISRASQSTDPTIF